MNQTCPFINGESLEIMSTVPLNIMPTVPLNKKNLRSNVG